MKQYGCYFINDDDDDAKNEDAMFTLDYGLRVEIVI